MDGVSAECMQYVQRLEKVPLIRITNVYQPNDRYCVIDFIDRQFPRRVVEAHTYGHYLSSVSVDMQSGSVEFNINKYVPASDDVVEFYLPESVCGPRIHVVFDSGAKRVGVQGSVGSFSDAVEVIQQYFQPL